LDNPWQPTASLDNLSKRAEIVKNLRDWFYQQSILEVETPQLLQASVTDPHIESFAVGGRFLRTSAEFHLKRLLTQYQCDLYELGKVFRVDESGRHHNPEFTMLEWYRVGMDHMQLTSDFEQLLEHLHQNTDFSFERISYRDLWNKVTGIDLANATCADIISCLQLATVDVPVSIYDNFDALQDLAMGTVIANSLQHAQYTCIYNYPASQASLARIDASDASWPVAKRFEIYFGSVELANGFHELQDPQEQLARFEADNMQREACGLKSMPIDKHLIAALQHGLPDCAGVAVGLDRLVKVLIDVSILEEVISFSWSRS